MIGSAVAPVSGIGFAVGRSWRHDVVASLPDGVLLLDREGAVTGHNPRAEALLREVSPALEPVGEPRWAVRQAIAEGAVNAEPRDIDRWLAEASETGSAELVVLTAAGRWLRLVALGLALGRTMVVITDITGARRREAWLVQSRDRLAAECESLRLLAGELADAVKTAEARVRELERLAYLDPLTGLLNRRRLFELAAREIGLAHRHQRPLAVLLIDIDRFKRVNDRLGHSAGDEVLRRVAASCATALRSTDLLARWGGEEFVAVLPHTDLDGAVRLGERLRRRLAGQDHGQGAAPTRLTVSIGAAAIGPAEHGLEALIDRADAALYGAKREGRNRVARAP